MKRLLVLSILVVLALLLYWLAADPTADLNQVAGPNVVSQNLATFTRQTEQVTEAVAAEKTQPRLEEATAPVPATADDSDNDLSYLELYRLKRQYDFCKEAIEWHIDKPNVDVTEQLQKHINRGRQPDQPPIQATAAQIRVFSQRHQRCVGIYQRLNRLDWADETDPKVEFNPFSHSSRLLQAWLEKTHPVSPKELAIADVLALKTHWQQAFQTVLEVSKGNDSKNQDEINALEIERRNVQDRYSQVVAGLRELRQEQNLIQDNIEITELRKQFAELHRKQEDLKQAITSLKWVDPVARKQAITAFDIINDQLFAKLSSPFPEVFFEAQSTLEMDTSTNYFGYRPGKNIGQNSINEPFVEYVSPGEVVMQVLGLKESSLFTLVAQPATILYHCELGAECGPDSIWVHRYCFKDINRLDPASCDLDLPTYLQNHRLNQNQLQDVQQVLAVLRGLYAN